MIVVTGATGHLGRLVIEGLLAKLPAERIVAAVRDPAKAADLAARGVKVRQADYSQPATLDAGFQGAERILFISGSEVGQRIRQHTAVIEAAKRAGTRQLIYTSILGGERTTFGLAQEHQETERRIVAAKLPHIFLRNGWYLENYTENMGPALEHGVILGSAGDGRIGAAARKDFADAAVAVLLSDNLESRSYELSGDEAYTMAEYAAELSRQSGRPVAYKDLPEAEYAAALVGFGMPLPVAQTYAGADAGISRGELQGGSGELRKLIGRPTTTLPDAISTALKARK